MTTEQTIHSSIPQLGAALLMLALAFLALFDGGLDHAAANWSLFGLVAVLALSAGTAAVSLPHRRSLQALLVYGGFCANALLSLFWSLDPYRTVVELFQLLAVGSVFAVAVTLDRESLFRVFRMVLVAAAVITLFGVSVFLLLSSSRMAATFANSNPFGTYLGMVSVLTFAWYIHGQRRSVFPLAVFLGSGLLLTGSRGAMLSVAVALPLTLLPANSLNLQRRVLQAALWIGAAFLLAQGLGFVAPYTQEMAGRDFDFMRQLLRPHSYASSTEGRFAFWQAAVDAGVSRPLRGYGLGTFFLAYYLEAPTDRWFSRFTHNHYLQTFAELGVIGFVLLVGFLYLALRAGFAASMSGRSPPFVKGLFAAMVVFCLHIGLEFSWNFPAVTALFFFLTGMAFVFSPEAPDPQPVRVPRWVAVPLVVLLAWVGVHLYVGHLYQTAASLDARGQVPEAAEVLERANALYPINAGSYRMLSLQYQKLFEAHQDPQYLEMALRTGQRAIELSPVDANGHQNLGNLYARGGRPEEAEHHLEEAVRYAGHRTRMFLELGWFYISQERMEEAVEVLEQGVSYQDIILSSTFGRRNQEQVETELVSMHVLLSRVHENLGDGETAHKYMVAARDINPEHNVVRDYFE